MAKLYIKPSNISWGSEHVVGDTFEIQVRIVDVWDCMAVQFCVEWDATVLELVDAVKGDFLEAAGVATWWFPSVQAGRFLGAYMRFEAPSGVNVPITDGLTATLRFKALKTGAANISLSPYDCFWFNSAWQAFSFTELQSATFTFGVPMPAYPKMVITSITAPTQAAVGETFDVLCGWRNDGEAGVAWARLVDLDTKLEVTPKTEFETLKGQSGTLKFSVVMPNKHFNLRLELGHRE